MENYLKILLLIEDLLKNLSISLINDSFYSKGIESEITILP